MSKKVKKAPIKSKSKSPAKPAKVAKLKAKPAAAAPQSKKPHSSASKVAAAGKALAGMVAAKAKAVMGGAHVPLAAKAAPTSKVKGKGKGKKLTSAQSAQMSHTMLMSSWGYGGAARTHESTGEAVCREVACEGLSTTGGYCRMHYIKNWKKIKRKDLILKEGKLNNYIEELVAKYPDKYIEAIRQDLANDKDFAKVIYDLDLDEGIDDLDLDSENVDSLIDNIKRDFDDEGDAF